MKDIDVIRRENMMTLESEAGGPTAAAVRLGWSQPQWSNLRSGAPDSKTGKPRGMRKETARRIEKAFGKPIGWLDAERPRTGTFLTPDLPPVKGVSAAALAATQGGHEGGTLLTGLSPSAERTGRVPLISWVQAGDWSYAADLLQPGEAYEWIDTSVAVQAHTFALRVEGDSMEPEFAPGTILVVEPELDAYPGDYVIAKNGDEATFKQLVRDGADLYLKPLNPRYPIKPLGDARVIGVVREAVKRYR